MVPSLETPVKINDLKIKNRLYRAPLLECAGEGPNAVDILINELEPAAVSGVGLICQGASPVRQEGGRVAPNMTSVADSELVQDLSRLTSAIHDHNARIFIQLAHGGIRTVETWHTPYRKEHPDLQQLAVSPLPQPLKLAESVGLLDYNLHVLTNNEVYELANDFGRCAAYAIEAGYDGIHLSGANMGIIQQFLSPFYNHRTDEFGGSLIDRTRFLEVVHSEIRTRIGEKVPVITKIPIETAAPWFIRPTLSRKDGIEIAKRLEDIGFDAVVPVQVSTFWDMSIVQGEYPERAWNDPQFKDDYKNVFGGKYKSQLVSLLNHLQAFRYSFEEAWNKPYCSEIKSTISIPVLAEGGIRQRSQMNQFLSEGQCDLVGMARPFYAEPRVAARLLNPDQTEDIEAICESCNNCLIPQVTGERGSCRTPDILQKRGELHQNGAYEVKYSSHRDR